MKSFEKNLTYRKTPKKGYKPSEFPSTNKSFENYGSEKWYPLEETEIASHSAVARSREVV